MAFDVGSVVAKVSADISEFKSGMDEAKNTVSGFGGTLSKIGDSIAGFGKQAAVFTGVLGAGLLLFAKDSIDVYTAEQNQIGQTEAALKTLQEAHIGTWESVKVGTGKAKVAVDDHAVSIGKHGKIVETNSEKVKVATAKLHDMEEAYKKAKTHTESSTVALDKQRQVVALMGEQVSGTSDIFVKKFVPAQLMTKDQVLAISDAMSQQTAQSRAEVLAGENMLLTFTNIGQKAFPEATSSMIDMATAMNNGVTPNADQLKETAIQLGKALNDPIKGTAALHRVGVAFTEQQKEQIKVLQNSGDMLGAQKIILKELNTEFGGRAAAAAETFQGKLRRMNNNLNDLKQEFGGFLVNALDPVIDGFSRFAQSEEVQQFVYRLVGAIKALGEVLLTGQISEGFKNLIGDENSPAFRALKGIHDAFIALGNWIMTHQELVISFLKGLAIGVGALVIVGGITALLMTLLNPLTLVVVAIGALYAAWESNWGGIQEKTQTVVKFIIDVFQEVLEPAFEAFIGWFKQRWDYIVLIFKGSWELIYNVVKLAWDLVYGIMKVGMQLMMGDWSGAWQSIKEMTGKVWEDLKGIFNGALDFIKGWAGTLYNNLTKPFEDAWNKIKEISNNIRGAQDPNQRHSPSLVDRVKKGVEDLNNAWGGLQFNAQISASQIGNQGGGSLAGAGVGAGGMTIQIDLSNSIISDNMAASRIAEQIGDGILARLKQNVRF